MNACLNRAACLAKVLRSPHSLPPYCSARDEVTTRQVGTSLQSPLNAVPIYAMWGAQKVAGFINDSAS